MLADRGIANRIWQEVPRVVMPLQERLLRLPRCLDDHTDALNPYRLDMVLQQMQMQEGDTYWSLLDQHDPLWLERVYEEIMAPSAERTQPLFPGGWAEQRDHLGW